MNKIEELAGTSYVTLLNMRPDTYGAEEEKDFKAKSVELSIEGSQRDIVSFLYEVENCDYPLVIKRLDFKIKNRAAGMMEAKLKRRGG